MWSYATSSLFNLHPDGQWCRHVRQDGEDRNTRRAYCVSFLHSSIAVPESIYIEVLVDRGNTLDMGDNKGVMGSEPMYNNDFGGAGSDETPLWLKLRIYFHLYH